MAPVTMPPVEEAKSLFRRLGYDVSGNGPELLAERKWRTVHVTATGSGEGDVAVADGGRDEYRFRCFVTWHEHTGDLANRLERRDPTYEWAVIGVDHDGDDHEVVHAG